MKARSHRPFSSGRAPAAPSYKIEDVVTRELNTSLGVVEVALSPGVGDVVLIFPGGHTTAATPLGSEIYTEVGYRTLTFSRPGYGCTNVGPLTAAEFVPAIAKSCELLGIDSAVAAVGLSFGGLPAVHVATGLPQLCPRLVLHSCAPSSLPYPDTVRERSGAPVLFGPRSARITWPIVRALTSTDRGLRAMMAQLSTVPVEQWWADWTAEDRAAARSTFSRMSSGHGFMIDVSQAAADRSLYRETVLRSIPCPTLVTASRLDGGVSFAHAEDFADKIPACQVVETAAWNHFAWLGSSRGQLLEAVRRFLVC